MTSWRPGDRRPDTASMLPHGWCGLGADVQAASADQLVAHRPVKPRRLYDTLFSGPAARRIGVTGAALVLVEHRAKSLFGKKHAVEQCLARPKPGQFFVREAGKGRSQFSSHDRDGFPATGEQQRRTGGHRSAKPSRLAQSAHRSDYWKKQAVACAVCT